MQHLREIMADIEKYIMENNPDMKTSLMPQAENANNLILRNFFPELQPILAKFPTKIKTSEYYIAVYWPDSYFAQAKNLMFEITHHLGGATCYNGMIGTWENPFKQVASDDILLIKSYCDRQKLIENFQSILHRICYWGKVCNQQAIAIEIGCFMGSIMLEISLV